MHSPEFLDRVNADAARLVKLQQEVGEWSRENFSDNHSKVPNSPVTLGHVASLLGLIEEMSEFYTAIQTADQEDALGDIGIYFADFAFRSGLDFGFLYIEAAKHHHAWLHSQSYCPTTAMPISLGKLCRVVLKRHQGIRGMLANEMYHPALRDAAIAFLRSWIWLGERGHANPAPHTVVRFTVAAWENIVKKRNWKANTADGQTPTLGTPIENGHVIYAKSDPDVPASILDSNGDVALGLCRRCHRGEIELEEPCDNRTLLRQQGDTKPIDTTHEAAD